MPPNAPNRLVYLFPALALAVVGLYYLYGALDQLGLESHQAAARITGKQITAGSTTYNTRIAGGRAWSQATDNPEAYIVTLELDGEATGGAVDPDTYKSLREDESVHVTFHRTRLSRRLVITDIRP